VAGGGWDAAAVERWWPGRFRRRRLHRKPRPAVIIQDDHFDTDSVTICPFTTNPADTPLIRLAIEPDQGNGLDTPSRIMVDQVTTVRRSRLGRKVGVLNNANVLRLNRALVVFLGIASST